MDEIYALWMQDLSCSNYEKKRLVQQVKCMREIYEAKESVYQSWGLNEWAIQLIIQHKSSIGQYQAMYEQISYQGIKVVGYFSEQYPVLLREIDDPPLVLYIKGRLGWLDQPMVGIVGARKCTEEGYRKAMRLGMELAECGVCVVSGMALGIDAAAHIGALKTGKSVAVLGTGVDQCYPNANRRIYETLKEEGCILSEYKPGTLARPYHFPRRNRIISGMCMGVLVVEAASKSGSLITAQLALDYNREVFAMPGHPGMSQGVYELIDNGAKCIDSAIDILDELMLEVSIKKELIKKNRDKMNNQLAQGERIVYAYVSQEPIFILNLKERLESTQLSFESINESLIQLEVKGLIKRLPGERYVRI